MKRILLLVFWCSVSLWADAQALLGTTGLLHAPTADMQRDKTFLFGGNYLNTHPLSTHFRSSEVGYTFNYYINITMFPWLEVSYICTLVHADHGSAYFPEQSWGKFTNQDRAFSARLRLWKEGWWKEWTPQIVLGLDDPTSHADHGGGVRVLAVKRHPQRGDHQDAGAGPGGVRQANGNIFHRAGKGVVAGAVQQHQQPEQQHFGHPFTAAEHFEGGGG